MRKVFGLTLSIALVLTAVAAVPVAAGNDKNDVGVEFGPQIEGNTFVNTNDTGDLVRFVVKLQKTRPDQSLYVEVWCGPTHIQSGNLAFSAADFLTTNGQGNGNTGAFWVDMSVCPAGDNLGHVDIGRFSSTFAELTSQFEYSNPV